MEMMIMKCFDYPELEELISGNVTGKMKFSAHLHFVFCSKCRSNYKMLKHDSEFVNEFKTGVDIMQEAKTCADLTTKK